MTTYATGHGPINDKGGELFYTDSGPVPGSTDYKTIIIFHGSAFTGHTFHCLLPMAAANNLRLVIPNRRNYAGSTKYHDDDLQSLREGKREFLESLGLETITFLAWYVRTNSIPKLSLDRKSGGLVTIGWSLGASTPLAMLAYPDLIPKELYSAIEPYYKQMIFYDAPHLAFGYDQPPEGYNPFTDPDLKSPEEVFANFGVWVSSYYDHPDLASRTPKGLDFSKRGPKITLDNMTPEDMKDNFDGAAAGRMEFPMYFVPMQPTLRTQADLALWNEKLAKNVLPELEIVHQFCTATNWYCVWGFFENERLLKEHNAAGHKVRQIKFIELPGANHFVHWDDPKAYLDAILKGL